jgi:hypothetical protein
VSVHPDRLRRADVLLAVVDEEEVSGCGLQGDDAVLVPGLRRRGSRLDRIGGMPFTSGIRAWLS